MTCTKVSRLPSPTRWAPSVSRVNGTMLRRTWTSESNITIQSDNNDTSRNVDRALTIGARTAERSSLTRTVRPGSAKWYAIGTVQ